MTRHAVALGCLLAACLLQSACSDPHPPSNFHLATVAVSPQHGLLFVSQPGFGTVDVLDIAPRRTAEAPRFVARLAEPGRLHVLRLSVDRKHGRLWVADFRLIQAYELAGLRELRKYVLPNDSYYERFSDLALDSAGNVFVLSRGGGRLYRIDAVSLEMALWLELGNQASDAALLLANRLLKTADDRHLFVASPARGELLRIDLRTKSVTPVALSRAADLTCGVLFWDQHPATIRAFDCTGRWEAQIALAEDRASGSVEIRGEARIPGTVTRFGP